VGDGFYVRANLRRLEALGNAKKGNLIRGGGKNMEGAGRKETNLSSIVPGRDKKNKFCPIVKAGNQA